MIKCFPFKVCLGFDMLFDLTQAHPGLKTHLVPVGSWQSSNIHLRVTEYIGDVTRARQCFNGYCWDDQNENENETDFQ